MSENWTVYKNGTSMEFYLELREIVRGKKEKIVLPKISEILKVKEFKIQKVGVFSELKQIFFEEYNSLKAYENTTIRTLKIRIIATNDREFSIEVQIRIDDTRHSGKPTHVNIDLKYEDNQSGKSENRSLIKRIGNIHETKVEQNLPKFFVISLYGSKGRNHTRFRFGMFPKINKEFHIKQSNFINKLKNRTLTEQDEILFKKEVSDYSQSLKKRLNLIIQ